MFAPKNILVPTDFSDCDGHCSMYAIKQAVAISKQHNSKLDFIHVVTDDLYKKPMFFLDDDKIEGLKEKMAEYFTSEIEKLIDEYASDVKDRCNIVVREGKPYTEILNQAKEGKSDLIVIATRGVSGLQGVFYGSVTEKVVRHASCSVLVVRKNLPLNNEE